MPRNTKIPDSKTKTIIKDMLSSVGVTLVKAVEERNAMFPDSASSAQNISNKLQRETISFREVVELAEALGLKIKWVPVCDDEPEIEFLSRNPSENEEKEFKEIASAGFESVESANYGFFLVVGANSKVAAEWMREQLKGTKTKEQELIIAGRAKHDFSVDIRIV